MEVATTREMLFNLNTKVSWGKFMSSVQGNRYYVLSKCHHVDSGNDMRG